MGGRTSGTAAAEQSSAVPSRAELAATQRDPDHSHHGLSRTSHTPAQRTTCGGARSTQTSGQIPPLLARVWESSAGNVATREGGISKEKLAKKTHAVGANFTWCLCFPPGDFLVGGRWGLELVFTPPPSSCEPCRRLATGLLFSQSSMIFGQLDGWKQNFPSAKSPFPTGRPPPRCAVSQDVAVEPALALASAGLHP